VGSYRTFSLLAVAVILSSLSKYRRFNIKPLFAYIKDNVCFHLNSITNSFIQHVSQRHNMVRKTQQSYHNWFNDQIIHHNLMATLMVNWSCFFHLDRLVSCCFSESNKDVTLTYPESRNGSKNVSPFHIHDWKPSVKYNAKYIPHLGNLFHLCKHCKETANCTVNEPSIH
jgi:hypothetical protein